MRGRGLTTLMLRACVSLVPSVGDETVLVRAHVAWYANSLCEQFVGMLELSGYKAVVSKDYGRLKVRVQDRAEFLFVSLNQSENCQGMWFKEVFTDHHARDIEHQRELVI